MKKVVRKVSSIVCVLLCLIIALTTILIVCNNARSTVLVPQLRTITLNDEVVDYSSFFNEFKDSELLIDKDDNVVEFAGTKTLDKSLFDEVDYIAVGMDNDGIDVRYEFKYDGDANEFLLSVIADTDDGEIIDLWKGTPFIEDDKIDIAFATDDGVLYLSELEESGVIENCGWFSRLWKKVVKAVAVVAVVAVVVATVVVAAPAVVAAVGGATATVAVGGATAGATLAGAAASGASVLLGTTLAVATTTAIAAVGVAVTTYVATKTYTTFREKVEDVAANLSKDKRYKGKMLFRRQLKPTINQSLTPRPCDDDGLSFFSSISEMIKAVNSNKGAFITTQELVCGTGSFLILRKKEHYAVSPFLKKNLLIWQATFDTAAESPHMYTEIMKGICYYVDTSNIL